MRALFAHTVAGSEGGWEVGVLAGIWRAEKRRYLTKFNSFYVYASAARRAG